MNYLAKNIAIAATVMSQADQVYINCYSKRVKNVDEHECPIKLHSMWGKSRDISS